MSCYWDLNPELLLPALRATVPPGARWHGSRWCAPGSEVAGRPVARPRQYICPHPSSCPHHSSHPPTPRAQPGQSRRHQRTAKAPAAPGETPSTLAPCCGPPASTLPPGRGGPVTLLRTPRPRGLLGTGHGEGALRLPSFDVAAGCPPLPLTARRLCSGLHSRRQRRKLPPLPPRLFFLLPVTSHLSVHHLQQPCALESFLS